METDLKKIKRLALKNEDEVDAFIEWLKLRYDDESPKLDKRLKKLLDKAMAHFDCKKCARCCKDAYVVLDTDDIGRLAEALGMKRSEFRRDYVGKNEDGDTCLNRQPCPFLKKNLCTLYESRPDCCREYPYSLVTDCIENLDNLNANYTVCPGIFHVLEELREFL